MFTVINVRLVAFRHTFLVAKWHILRTVAGSFTLSAHSTGPGQILIPRLFNQWFKQPIIKSVFTEATGGKVSQLAE